MTQTPSVVSATLTNRVHDVEKPVQTTTSARSLPTALRVARMGHDHRLCPRCSTADHGTCSACRRHRLLVVAPNGDALCKACNEQGEIACPSCGNPMPAGRGDACEPCYWTRTCRKRITIGQAGITIRLPSRSIISSRSSLSSTRHGHGYRAIRSYFITSGRRACGV